MVCINSNGGRCRAVVSVSVGIGVIRNSRPGLVMIALDLPFDRGFSCVHAVHEVNHSFGCINVA
jgi:hypothetical protein